MDGPIKVRINGCVPRMGEYQLSAGSSVADLLRLAGGIGREQFEGTGVITVRNRRKKDRFPYVRRAFSVKRIDPRRVILRDGDFMVVQYDVAQKNGGLTSGQRPTAVKCPTSNHSPRSAVAHP